MEAATRVFVEGVQVGQPLFRVPGIVVHRGSDEAGCAVSVVVLQALTTEDQKVSFENIVRYASLSGIGIRERQEHVILATPEPTGTLRHLPWDAWSLAERLERFVKVASIVVRFHAAGEPVGTLTPDHIVVDEELEPFILAPRLGPLRGEYVAPETATAREINVASDIFTLGKLLHFMISGEDPVREHGVLAKLEQLLTFPAGLVRIVRKATCQEPRARYASVEDLLKDVGIYGRHSEVGVGHPEVEETNLGGLSQAPTGPDSDADKAAKAPEPKEPDYAEMRVLPSESRRHGRRIFHAFMIAVLLAAGVPLVVNFIRASRKLESLDSQAVAELSEHLQSAAFSDDFPPVLFAQVGPSWGMLEPEARQAEAARLRDALWSTYGVRDGYLHRGSALVVQYWNKQIVLVRR